VSSGTSLPSYVARDVLLRLCVLVSRLFGTRKVVSVLVLIFILIKKSLGIFNDNTNFIISYICNFKTLIFTCISIIYSDANACMQHFQFVTAFVAVLLWLPSNPGFSVAIDE